MRKFNFMILFLGLMSFSSNAEACLPAYSPYKNWLDHNIFGTPGALVLWLCIFAVYYGIRGLICCLGKDDEKRKLKFKYLHPVWIYTLGIAMIFVAGYFHRFDLYYLGYTLFVVLCAGYQLQAYIRHKEPKNWSWICPIVPFYANSVFASIIILADIDTYARLFWAIGIFVLTTYGFYKLGSSKIQKHPQIFKIVWGVLTVGAFVYGSYILYANYTYVNEYQGLEDCM